MILEDQVCNLELSRKLKSLGCKQESLWYWVYYWNSGRNRWSIFQKDGNDKVNEHVSAFTVAELGEMLPDKLTYGVYAGKRQNYYLTTTKLGNSYSISYNLDLRGQKDDCITRFIMDTEANARAKMLIYLIENKLRLEKKEV